jgi:hypothetical protein
VKFNNPSFGAVQKRRTDDYGHGAGKKQQNPRAPSIVGTASNDATPEEACGRRRKHGLPQQGCLGLVFVG